jgi:methionyl-tRNA formyltransferase
MRLLFCGTPNFAVPTLKTLLEAGFVIDVVITNPDEASGRGYEPHSPPVKRAAVHAGLQVFQPAKLKEPATQVFISKFQPDAILVVAYGRIIPGWMIALPRLGCINLHASLLPKYRGAAPIPWAIIRGERVTGVTTMKIDAGLDTGDILLAREVEISAADTTESLSERLSVLGADLMVDTLQKLEARQIVARPQDDSQATFAPILKKEDGRINWSNTAEEVWRRVRGLRPWPGAFTVFRGKGLHIWSAVPSAGESVEALEPGTLIAKPRQLLVQCGEATLLEITELQLQGRNRMPVREFLNGERLAAGERFESP